VKTYHVIRIKFNQSVDENVHMIVNLPTERTSDSRVANISKSFFPQDGGENHPAQIVFNEITSLSPAVLARGRYEPAVAGVLQ